MRDYGRVFCALWASPDFRSLSEDARTLVLYLLTSPHGTMIGAFSLPDGYISEDIQWPMERVSKGFTELFAKGFCNRCGTTKWAWIRKYLEWNAPENPNQWIAARKLAAKIPEQCSWRAEFQRDFSIRAGDIPEPSPNRSQTLPESGSGTVLGTGDRSAPAAPAQLSLNGKAAHAPKPRRSSRVPEDFHPDLAYARAQVPGIDAESEAQKFRDWEFKTPKSDWPATWRRWITTCRETGKYARISSGGDGSGLQVLNFG